jgi:uncharacterized protein
MGEHANVALVRGGFEAFDKGDIQAAIDLFSPDVHYYGYDATGHAREFEGRDAFFGMVLEATSQMDENVTELLDAVPVGDSMVMARVRGHRRARGSQDTLDTEFVMVFRIEDGKVTHGVDLIDRDAEEFYNRLGTGVTA